MKEGMIVYSGLPSEVVTEDGMQEIYGVSVLVAGEKNGLCRGVCVPILSDKKMKSAFKP